MYGDFQIEKTAIKVYSESYMFNDGIRLLFSFIVLDKRFIEKTALGYVTLTNNFQTEIFSVSE